MASKPKRPRDVNQLGKLVADLATGEAKEKKADEGKDPAAVALGRKGGKKGGHARAKALSPQQRRDIARLAAKARWKKNND